MQKRNEVEEAHYWESVADIMDNNPELTNSIMKSNEAILLKEEKQEVKNNDQRADDEKVINPLDDSRLTRVDKEPLINHTSSRYPESKPIEGSKFTAEEELALYPTLNKYDEPEPQKPEVIFEPKIPTCAEITAKMDREAKSYERKYSQ